MAQIKTTYDAGVGAGGFALDSLADPANAFRHFDDFNLNLVPHVLPDAASGDDTQTLDAYTIVQLSSNSTYPAASTAGGYAGGTMRFTTHTGADDGMIMYPTGMKIEAPNSKDCSFEVRFAMQDVANQNFFIGFSEAVATGDIISAGAVVAAADGRDRIGWFIDDATTAGKAQVFCSNGTAGLGGTVTGESVSEYGAGSANTAIADGDMHRFGVTVTGSTVRFFLDGELKQTVENASLVPSAQLIPCLHLTTANGAAEIFDVDYIDAQGKR
tara:strand:- start:3261 stop:4073 length:813 start_codon:yes stop_codon:yes gene_type:complete